MTNTQCYKGHEKHCKFVFEILMCVILPLLMFSYQNLAGNCVAGESFEKSAWNEKKGSLLCFRCGFAHCDKKISSFVQKQRILQDLCRSFNICEDYARFRKILQNSSRLFKVQQEHIRVCIS